MKTRDQQAKEYAKRFNEGVKAKLKLHQRKPNGMFHAFDLYCAFQEGWNAALIANANATETLQQTKLTSNK